MNAFITGVSGFIGGRLARLLLDKGWRVRALVHKNPLLEEGGIESVRGDVREPGSWKEALRGTDVLFHLAAALGFTRASKKEFLDINAGGTDRVLQAAGDARVGKIVHVSSAGVIGSVKDGDIAAESYPPNPQNAYDLSKLEAERIALRFSETGMNVVVVRPGWAYGPGDRRTFKLIKAIHGRRFALIAPDRGRQTPVFIDDLVEGLNISAEKGKTGEIYHLVGDEILSIREMAAAVAEACSVKVPRFSLPVVPAQTAAWALEKMFALFHKEAPLNRSRLSFFLHAKALSNEKAKKELGFRPAVDFRSGIGKTVAWYKEQGWI